MFLKMKPKLGVLLFISLFLIYNGIYAATFKESRSNKPRQSSTREVVDSGTDDETETTDVVRPNPENEEDGDDNERITSITRQYPQTRTTVSGKRGGRHGSRRDDDDGDEGRGKSKGKGKSRSMYGRRSSETDTDDEDTAGSTTERPKLKSFRSGSPSEVETVVGKAKGGKQRGRWGHLLQDVQKLHGTNKHKGKKKGKREKFKNEKSYLWKGKLIRRAGPDANDPAPSIHVPEHDEIRHLARSCKIDFEHTSEGPSADGAQSEHFQPCQERKRGGRKRGRWTQQEQPLRSERKKRSESYSSVRLLWPDPERILIKFDNSYPESKRNNVRRAWQFWQNKTCLKFHEQPSSVRLSEPHILMTLSYSGSCSTDRLGPNLSPPYTTVIDTAQCSDLIGSIAHELGHALGLAHSQKRVDRDGAVNVAMQNIAPSWRSQFDKDNEKQFDEWGVPYFYDSIMHYFPYASTTNGLMTICPLDPVMESVMGQREEPAFGDVSLINRIYCQESCFNKNELQNVNFNGNLSMTISGRTCQNWATQYPQKHRYTSLGNHESCRNPDKWAGGPWCYTKDPSVPYEPCFSSCEDLEKLKRAYCHGWCYNGGYHSPTNCECVCPKFATGKFCENINPALKYGHLTCGKVIDLKRGVKEKITTPNYPRDYGYNSLCIWWIRAPKGMRVKATVDDFMLETADDEGCYDYLEIRKSICAAATNHPEDMRYCGNSLTPGSSASPKSLTSNDENMVIKFTSDDHENAKGFSITLQAV